MVYIEMLDACNQNKKPSNLSSTIPSTNHHYFYHSFFSYYTTNNIRKLHHLPLCAFFTTYTPFFVVTFAN